MDRISGCSLLEGILYGLFEGIGGVIGFFFGGWGVGG